MCIRDSYDTDPYGNIVAFIKGSMKDTPPLAFVSHMDHPGFEVDGDQEEDGLYARVLGGVPVASIVSGMVNFLLPSFLWISFGNLSTWCF